MVLGRPCLYRSVLIATHLTCWTDSDLRLAGELPLRGLQLSVVDRRQNASKNGSWLLKITSRLLEQNAKTQTLNIILYICYIYICIIYYV